MLGSLAQTGSIAVQAETINVNNGASLSTNWGTSNGTITFTAADEISLKGTGSLSAGDVALVADRVNLDAASAIVRVKHFTKSLHSSQLTQPAQVGPFCRQRHFLACRYNGVTEEQPNQSAISLAVLQQVLCGIGDTGGHVHFMFVYRDPFSEAGYDDKISLSYKLPVLQENDL